MPHKNRDRRNQYARERYAKLYPWHEKTDEERFWEKVDKNGPIPSARPDLGPCWLWKAGKTPGRHGGYGKFRFRGKTTAAHRVAYLFAHGKLPESLETDHLCRTHECVRYSHLEMVTGRENQLRGVGFPAQNAKKTVCKNGHPLCGENLGLANGKYGATRFCKFCLRNAQAAYRQRHPKSHAGDQGWHNRIKTHCKSGHPFDEGNTIMKHGKRACRECMRRWMREAYYRRRARVEL